MSGDRRGILIVISGPSGVGKSSVCARLVERLGALLSVSATTRPRGKGEVDGQNYLFLSRDAFERMLAEGGFLEHAEYLGNLYGTPAEPVRQALERGQDVVLDIEVQGGMQVARQHPDAVMVYLLAADRQVLADRIRGRGRDDAADVAKRLANAEREIGFARSSGVYGHFVVNDVLEETVLQIVRIVEDERKARTGAPAARDA